MATDNIKNFNDFLDRMQEIIYETRKQFAIESGKPFDYENATIVQKDFAPVKPKFKEGDWIVFNDHTFYIKEVAFGFYKTISKEYRDYNYDWCIDKMARLWTVEDAREGDVLTDYCDEYKNPLIFILKKFERVDFGLVRPSDYSSYCFLTMGDRPRFKEGQFHHMHDVKPATEEQRDTLMKAMHEAGYTFDFEKKGLRKIESKFHVGDWVVDSQGLTHQIGGVVENVTTHTFGYDTVGGGYFNDDTEGVHLWTIQDAKDGDVLACNEEILIFKSYSVQGRISLYCWYNGQTNNFHSKEVVDSLLTTRNKIWPATKEQRDQLEKVMANAGYAFDFEKKELKKIEPKFHVGEWIIKKQNSDINKFGKFRITDIKDGKYWYNEFIICEITEQDEWETVKVEPKFNEGDWIVNGSGTYKIVEVCDSCYKIFSHDYGMHCFISFDKENDCHLWTLEDAKEGEVLVASDDSIFIFAGADCACKYYVALTNFNEVKINKKAEGGYWETLGAVHPATKEQRETLMKEIHKAGYEWIEETKELKKVEQKYADRIEPKFDVGDWIVHNNSGSVYKVTEIRDDEYCICPLYAEIQGYVRITDVDNDFHLWTLEDAREGDVLAEDSCIFIIRKLNRDHSAKTYCCLFDDGDFTLNSNLEFDDTSTYPATKEQRDKLEKAMHKAGYEWIEEKKEIKKIEPKFHEGDWIVTPENNVLQIATIEGTSYTFNGEVCYWEIYYCNEQCHLWTIQDAKAGDVLACGNDIVIFKENNYNPKDKSGCMFAYCSCNNFREIGGINPTDYKPATKEQREELEKAMADAGYTFDFDKKELKKIEEKSVVEMKTPEESLDIDSETYNKIVDECIYGEQNPLWTEDDERMYKAISIALTLKNPEGYLKSWYITPEDADNWLKALKDKVQLQDKQEWKPTDEQIRQLGIVATGKGWFNTIILNDLLEQLKKLKGE